MANVVHTIEIEDGIEVRIALLDSGSMAGRYSAIVWDTDADAMISTGAKVYAVGTTLDAIIARIHETDKL